MDSQKQTFVWTFAAVCVVVACVVLLASRPVIVVSPTSEGGIGTGITYNAQNGSYTDGADFRQNVQAIAERMSGRTQYQILQADANGEVQAVAPTAVAGTWNFSAVGVNTTTPTGEIDAWGGASTSSLSLTTDGTMGSCFAVQDAADGSDLFFTFISGTLTTSTVDCR